MNILSNYLDKYRENHFKLIKLPKNILLETQKLKINKFLLDQKTDLITKNLKGVGFDFLAESVINL